MDPEKKTGLLCIAIGICIPLLVLPFVSGYSKDKSIFQNLYGGVAIDLQRGAHVRTDGPEPIDPNRKAPSTYSKLVPKRIPFRFFLVFTLVFFYMGIVRIDRARRRQYDRDHGFGRETKPLDNDPIS